MKNRFLAMMMAAAVLVSGVSAASAATTPPPTGTPMTATSTVNYEALVSGYVYDAATHKPLTGAEIAQYQVKVQVANPALAKSVYAVFASDGKYRAVISYTKSAKTLNLTVTSPFYKSKSAQVAAAENVGYSFVIEKNTAADVDGGTPPKDIEPIEVPVTPVIVQEALIYGYLYDRDTGKRLTGAEIAQYQISLEAAYDNTLGKGSKKAVFASDGKYRVVVPSTGSEQWVSLTVKSPFYKSKTVSSYVGTEANRPIIIQKNK